MSASRPGPARPAYRVSRRLVPRLLPAFLLPLAAFGAEPPVEPPPFVVGMALLELPEGLGATSPAAAGLASGFPLLLARELSPLPGRSPGPAWLAEAAARRRDLELLEAGELLAARLDELAARKLDPSPTTSARETSLAAARKAVAQAREKLDALLAAVPGEAGAGVAPAGQGRQVALLWAGYAQGKFLAPPGADQGGMARREKLDLLVSGKARALQGGYVSLELRAWDGALGREAWSRRYTLDPADPAPVAREAAASLAELIAGEPLLRLDIGVEPPSALVLVDGRALPAGSGTAYVYSPAAGAGVRVEARAPGRSPANAEIPARAGERIELDLVLPVLESGFATIESEPTGALVYVDGLAAGRTPLELALAGRKAVAEISAAGYEPALAVLPAEGGARLSISLREEDGLGPEGRLARAKDGFYGALGWLVLGLAVSSYARGANDTALEAWIRSPSDTSLSRARATSTILISTAALSAALGANAAWRLAGYIGATRQGD